MISWPRWPIVPPPLAVIESVETQEIPVVGGTGFVIADTSRSDGGRTLASPDVAMCADCAAEQRDPANRRYRHAFVNCTNCGPRFTIIASLPYDRAATTMAGVPDVRRSARANTTIRPTDGSTHSRSAARTAGRRCATGPPTAPTTRGEAALTRRPAAAARRRHPRRQGHRRIPPGLRRRQRARGRRTAQRASAAATSRSRSWWPISASHAASRTSTTRRSDCCSRPAAAHRADARGWPARPSPTRWRRTTRISA